MMESKTAKFTKGERIKILKNRLAPKSVGRIGILLMSMLIQRLVKHYIVSNSTTGRLRSKELQRNVVLKKYKL